MQTHNILASISLGITFLAQLWIAPINQSFLSAFNHHLLQFEEIQLLTVEISVEQGKAALPSHGGRVLNYLFIPFVKSITLP